MEFYAGIQSYRNSGRAAVALGKFNGVHRGHQKLIDKLNEYQSQEVKRIMFAFDMEQKMLLTEHERQERIAPYVDEFILCPFSDELRQMSAHDFVVDILIKQLNISHVVVGEDFRFGYQAHGDAKFMQHLGQTHNFHVDVIAKEMYHQREISSTYIRERLDAGDIVTANDMLGYEYSITGKIEYGQKLGRKLGFPTINVAPPTEKIIPRFGVYTCIVKRDGRDYPGVCGFGTKPTIEGIEPRPLAEVYLFDVNEEWYGESVTIFLHQFIRGEEKFDSIEVLKNQVDDDIKQAKNLMGLS